MSILIVDRAGSAESVVDWTPGPESAQAREREGTISARADVRELPRHSRVDPRRVTRAARTTRTRYGALQPSEHDLRPAVAGVPGRLRLATNAGLVAPEKGRHGRLLDGHPGSLMNMPGRITADVSADREIDMLA